MFGDVSDLDDGVVPSKVSQERAKRFDEKLSSRTDNANTQTISILPPALKCLVHLWEELTNNCLQVRSRN